MQHGIDIVLLRSFLIFLNDADGDFKQRCFTANELSLAQTRGDSDIFLAGRYAAKEAVAKALGTGFTTEVAAIDIEILQQPNGAPELRLHGGANRTAARLLVEKWALSINHTQDNAFASAIAICEEP